MNLTLFSIYTRSTLFRSLSVTQTWQVFNDYMLISPPTSRCRRAYIAPLCFFLSFTFFFFRRLISKVTERISTKLGHTFTFLANVNVLFAICYRPSVCRLSVCLSSVTLVHPTQAVELFGNFFSPYDSSGTLLFWCQKSLVGDAPFPLKFAFKVTHPL